MTLDETLRKILGCPKCNGALHYEPKQETLTCAPCGLRFKVEDGIPVLLLDEAESIS